MERYEMLKAAEFLPVQIQEKLEALLTATVEIPGENNSILLVGPRGVGKTLVENLLPVQ